MQLLKKTFINVLMILGLSCGLTVSAVAADFATTKLLAEQGNVASQYNLGYLYDNGQGVRQDFDKAVEWYQKAAEQGLMEAQYNLALKYENGRGVRQDFTKAFKLYQKAAEQGDSSSQLNLGYMYYTGKGVRQDFGKAKEWSGKACDNGQQIGCNNYRKLNEQGY